MPYVLKHRHSSQIFTCLLTNKYDFTYYGVVNWDFLDSAQQEVQDFLVSQEVDQPEQWEIIKVDENQLKLMNVKLKNDASKRIYFSDDGKSTVK